ncbi:MAG: TRAP transporter small permease subunit [Gammaproteobacteria bacterium]
MIRWLHTVERGLIQFESIAAAASLLLLLTLMLVQIFTRNLFDFGFPEIEVITRNLLVMCGAFGAVLATPRMRHIKIDALTPFLSSQKLYLLSFPLALFSALACAAMAYYAAIFSLDEWEYAPSNERWALPFTLMYPLGFSLLSFHFVMLCFRPRTK